jgi:tetratricopeptide (TPR) repeat protein
VRRSLKATGIGLRHVRPEEIPFQFDSLFKEAQMAEKEGNWAKAAEMFEYIADRHKNELWMKTLAAKALYKTGNLTSALKLSSEVNQQRPTVNTLLLEAKLNRERKNFSSAIDLLERAEQILEGPVLLQAGKWQPLKEKNCYGCKTGQQY